MYLENISTQHLDYEKDLIQDQFQVENNWF